MRPPATVTRPCVGRGPADRFEHRVRRAARGPALPSRRPFPPCRGAGGRLARQAAQRVQAAPV
eukprot:1803194-Lingulodinium_polyedra.AAC.1